MAKVKTKNAAASGEDPGLIPVAAYKPQLDPKVPQVLLIRDAEQGARLCLVAVPGYFLQTLKDQRDVGANG